ncbi:MAG: N-acetyl-gamma-glutamyl-phosphate reductase [Campylobacterales bacterium]|nr:N-acetyl-gamma-glutamyl-phosphate reductase [Campylobacterales bacterium]
MKTINVAVVGASGYTGLELIKMIINHPNFNLTYVANTTGEVTVDELHPALQDIIDLEVVKADSNELVKKAELAFLALPHKASMGFAKELLAQNIKVVDLSADYRLELDTYEEWYCPHEDKQNLPLAVYGMPEIFREYLMKTMLVANPGCYPTASILPLLPFLNYIDEGASIYIDAKSGVSGAGKGCKDVTHFGHVNENIFAYNPFKHRHMPEIKEKLKIKSKKDFNVLFVPHLIPVTRGMLVSTFVKLNQTIENPLKILKEYYKDEPFVRIREKPVDIKSTTGTNFCDIYADVKDGNLFLSSSIDNLLKGASSAAIVNANIMCGLEEDAGVPKIAYVP